MSFLTTTRRRKALLDQDPSFKDQVQLQSHFQDHIQWDLFYENNDKIEAEELEMRVQVERPTFATKGTQVYILRVFVVASFSRNQIEVGHIRLHCEKGSLYIANLNNWFIEAEGEVLKLKNANLDIRMFLWPILVQFVKTHLIPQRIIQSKDQVRLLAMPSIQGNKKDTDPMNLIRYYQQVGFVSIDPLPAVLNDGDSVPMQIKSVTAFLIRSAQLCKKWTCDFSYYSEFAKTIASHKYWARVFRTTDDGKQVEYKHV